MGTCETVSSLNHASLKTPVCDVLGCDAPVVLAGMGGVSRAELVAAVSEAGGFGFLGMVRESPTLIRSEIERVRALTTRNFGVNLIPAATDPDLLEMEIEAVIAAQVKTVSLFWDLRAYCVQRLLNAGCVVVCQVGSVEEGEAAAAAGAHVLIAQGVEAGGHVRGTQVLAKLVPELVAHVDVPVLAAGGIVNGKGLATMLELGAQGVVLGTAFLATRESFAHDYHKQRIVEARANATVYTEAFHINWPASAPVRVLRNSVTRGDRGDPFSGHRSIIGHEGERPIYLFSTDSPLKNMTGDFEAMALYAGAGAEFIDSIPTAAERLNSIVAAAQAQLQFAAGSDTDEVSTVDQESAVGTRRASNAVRKYFTREELIRELNALLELLARLLRERDVQMAETSPAETRSPARADDRTWCAALRASISRMDATPSVEWVDGDSQALSDPFVVGVDGMRSLYLECVRAKLRRLLPRVRDNGLRDGLGQMLHDYEARNL